MPRDARDERLGGWWRVNKAMGGEILRHSLLRKIGWVVVSARDNGNGW